MTTSQHGTITHVIQGVSLTGEIIDSYPRDFYFKIDGSAYANNFQHKDWTFTPDKPALPTEPGFYRPESEPDWNGAYHLNIRGQWSYINGHDGTSSPQATSGIKTPLVRLIPESTEA